MDIMLLLALIFFGAVGQAVRSIVGLRKALQNEDEIDEHYWISTILLGAVIGAVCGWVAPQTIELFGWVINEELAAFIGGYLGMDFLEGMVGRFWKEEEK